MPRAIDWTDEQIKVLRVMYEDGATYRSLVEFCKNEWDLAVGSSTIGWLKKRGWIRGVDQKRKFTKVEDRQIISYCKSRNNLASLADKFGCANPTIHRRAKELGYNSSYPLYTKFSKGNKYGTWEYLGFDNDKTYCYKVRCIRCNDTVKMSARQLKSVVRKNIGHRKKKYSKICSCRIVAVNRDLYKIHYGIMTRCNNTKHSSYKNYGSQGIGVYKPWRDPIRGCYLFVKYVIDNLGERPSKEYSLDRSPDPAGNYEPGNIRWATKKMQAETVRRWKKDVLGTINTYNAERSRYCMHPKRIVQAVERNLPLGRLTESYKKEILAEAHKAQQESNEAWNDIINTVSNIEPI